MRVFVAGATGAIGRPLIPSLVAAGHQVTGSTRSPAKAAKAAKARRELGRAPGYPSWRDGFPQWAKQWAKQGAKQGAKQWAKQWAKQGAKQ